MRNILFGLALMVASAQASEQIETITVTAPAYGNYQIQYYVPEEFEESFHIQETSPGQLSPYIGPFTGNTVNQLVNGIRVSNAYFRSGPNQYFGWIPNQFVETVSVSDGGNIGGTINRNLSVPDSHVGLLYNSAVLGQTVSASVKQNSFGVAILDTDFGDVRTAQSKVKNSSYNQRAALFETDLVFGGNTSLLYSRNDDIPRTDRWNGGTRITGTRAGTPFNYELQELLFLNHEQTVNDFDINIAYQDFAEHIRKSDTLTKMLQHSYTVNVNYNYSDSIRFYSLNTMETLEFQANQSTAFSKDSYDTYSYGISFVEQFGDVEYWVSLGYKIVDITDVKSFETPEYSVLLGRNGIFASYDYTTRPPSYSDVLQDKATGRGTVIPNSNLNQETAGTLRLGYNKQGIYFDMYLKKVKDSFSQITVDTDVYQLVNAGNSNVIGTTVGYSTDNLFGTDITLNTRLEYVWSEQENANGVREPMQKTPDFWTFARLEYRNWFTVLRYQPRDRNQPFKDLDDVRIFAHNNGFKTVDIGYTGSFDSIEYSIRANNIFDDDGRVYGSSVDVPGRSIIISLNYVF